MKLSLILATLVLTARIASAESAAVGLSGLGEMRTPDTLSGDRSEVYFAMRYRLLAEDMGKQITPALGYTQGFGDALEAGVQIPFRIVDDGSGLANIPVAVKYRFMEWEFLRFSGSAHIDLPTASQDKKMGSGKLGFAGEFQGQMVFGALELDGSLSYGKGDYCPGCQNPGRQSNVAANPVNVPVFGLAGGLGYSFGTYKAFGELHFDRVASGDQGGMLPGDPNVSILIGGRGEIYENVSATLFAGIGYPPNEGANQKVLAGLMASYTIGEKPSKAKERAEEAPEAPAVAPAPPALPVVSVVDGCDNAKEANKLLALLKKEKFDARSAGKAPAKVDVTSIHFTEASIGPGSEIARIIPGKQQMFKEASLEGGVAVKVVAGCDLAPKPVPPPVTAAPLPPKKAKELINIGIINGCGKAGMAEDAAKTLLLNGYNVTAIADAPKQTTPGLTEIRFREEYKEEAADIAAKLPGRQRLYVDKALAADLDLNVIVGCEL